LHQVFSDFIVIVAVLSASSSFSSNNFVWNTFVDNSGLEGTNTWYIYLIGLLNACYGFSGYEAGGHMAEETKNASVAAPKGIIFTCIASGVVGFSFIISLLYSMGGDLNNTIDGESESAIVNIFMIVFKNRNTSLAITCILIGDLFFAGFSSMTVTSRIGFSMARDGAVPFSKFFSVVYKKT